MYSVVRNILGLHREWSEHQNETAGICADLQQVHVLIAVDHQVSFAALARPIAALG